MRFRMHKLAGAVLAFALAAGCFPPEPAAPPETGGLESGPGDALPPPPDLDVGTVEATLFIEAKAAPEADEAGLRQETLPGMRSSVSLATVEVDPPHPARLPIAFQLRGTQAYPRVVLLRGFIYRDEEPIAPYEMLLGGGIPIYAYSEPVLLDVLEGLDAPPESMLIVAKADVLLLPPDTDPAEVDFAGAEVHADDEGFIMSNPVRIHFLPPDPESAPQAEAPAEDAGPAEDGASLDGAEGEESDAAEAL